MTDFGWIYLISYLIVGLYVHDVRWRMWKKRNMSMFLEDRLASLLAWPFWIYYCLFFYHVMFIPVDIQKHVVGKGISNLKIGRCIHCNSLLLQYDDAGNGHHLFSVEEKDFKEIFGFDHKVIFKG